MKTRKLLALLVAMTMVFAAFGGLTAHAVSENLVATATREGNTLTFAISLANPEDFAGIDTKIPQCSDENVFTRTGYSYHPELSGATPVTAVVIGTSDGMNRTMDGTLIAVTYAINPDAFKKGVDYVFSIEVTQFYNEDFDDLDQYFGVYSVTYSEPDDTPTPTPTVAPTPTAAPTAAPTAKPEDVIYVKKTVRSENDYGTETFNFTAECVSVEGNNGQVSPADAPAITIGSITMTYPDTEGTVDLPSLTFPMGGVYTYKITEVNGGTDFWSYDSTEYYIVFEVEPDREGNLVIDRYYIHTGSATGDKADEIEFVNTYAALTDLTITKTVVGDTAGDDVNPMADVMFDFSITFDKTFTGKINGEDVTFTSGEPYTFQLGNGDELNIGNIPAGATYTLVETGKEYYTGSAVVVSGDSSNTVDGEYAADLTVTGTAEPTDELGINKVDVTNTYSIPPITGITMHGEMIAIIALALVALVGGFVLSRKLRRSED